MDYHNFDVLCVVPADKIFIISSATAEFTFYSIIISIYIGLSRGLLYYCRLVISMASIFGSLPLTRQCVILKMNLLILYKFSNYSDDI